jgi:uncharacterized alkaline shock family protein YloU
VVSKIAGIAAQEVDGIRMGSGASQTASNLLGSITGGGSSSQTQGVSVEVGQEEAALDLTLTAEYGKSIPQLAEAVRRNVSNRVESLVGLRVTEVNITVQNIFFPSRSGSRSASASSSSSSGSSRPRNSSGSSRRAAEREPGRFWQRIYS